MSIAVVCFSGGQDSTTALGMALRRYEAVYTIGFDYGQRHRTELECRRRILERIEGILGTRTLKDDVLVDLRALGQISACAMTREEDIVCGENGLPTTFVPGRNLLFCTYAAALAYKVGAHDLILGVSETDYSGYPDCRRESLDPLEASLSAGMDYPIRIRTPFAFLGKADEWRLAEETGGARFVDFVVEQTHTCYLGDRGHRHEWGYGCGRCPACVLRREGFQAWRGARPS